MPKNITVLGANGFIGRHLTLALAQDPETHIKAFARFRDYQSHDRHPFFGHRNIEMIAGDFFNRDDLLKAVQGSEYVFHLITATTPASSNNDPLIDIDTNLRASVELLQLCVEAGVKKVIFPSSGGTVYGETDQQTMDEGIVPCPISPYAIIKLAIEHYLRYFKKTHNLNYIVYRVANPYGPGQNIRGKQGVVPIFMHNITEGYPVTVYGDGSMVRDYIYISDLIKMIIASYDKDNRFAEYNLGSGKGVSVNDIIAAIEECSGAEVQKQFMPTPQSFVDKSILNTNRFLDEFNVGPTVDIAEGIKNTWRYVKETHDE